MDTSRGIGIFVEFKGMGESRRGQGVGGCSEREKQILADQKNGEGNI